MNRLFSTSIPIFAIFMSIMLCRCDDELRVVYPKQELEVKKETVFTVDSPFWSRDDAKLLFIGHLVGDPGDGFYEVDPQGGHVQLLALDTLAKRDPVLSPDGTMIAYLAAHKFRLYGFPHVWVINRDGTNPRDLTPMGGCWEYVRWSPDSRYLLFDGGVEEFGEIHKQIIRADVITGELKMLTRGTYDNLDASYSDDGGQIVYASHKITTEYGAKVWIMNSDGSHQVPLDSSKRATIFPRIRPHRNEVWFSFGMDGSEDEGTYSVRIDSAIFPTSHKHFQFRSRDHFVRDCQWSPDGSRVISLMRTSSLTDDLYVTDGDTYNPQFVTSGFEVYLMAQIWSTAGEKMVFQASNRRDTTLFTYIYDVGRGQLGPIPILFP